VGIYAGEEQGLWGDACVGIADKHFVHQAAITLVAPSCTTGVVENEGLFTGTEALDTGTEGLYIGGSIEGLLTGEVGLMLIGGTQAAA